MASCLGISVQPLRYAKRSSSRRPRAPMPPMVSVGGITDSDWKHRNEFHSINAIKFISTDVTDEFSANDLTRMSVASVVCIQSNCHYFKNIYMYIYILHSVKAAILVYLGVERVFPASTQDHHKWMIPFTVWPHADFFPLK